MGTECLACLDTGSMTPLPPWREPSQERSRARVARMVETARGLIAEGGIESLNMEAVARGADVPIGSVYQFFPDRTALLARILNDLFEGAHAYLTECFAGVTSGEEFVAAGSDLIVTLYRLVADDPAMFEVWHAVGASPVLRQLDLDDTTRNADVVFQTARPLTPDVVTDERLFASAFLLCDLLGTVIRTAIARGPDGDRFVDEFVAMSSAHFGALFQTIDTRGDR